MAGSGWFTLVCEVAASGTGGIWPTGAAPGAGDSELVSPAGVLVVPLSQAPTGDSLGAVGFRIPCRTLVGNHFRPGHFKRRCARASLARIGCRSLPGHFHLMAEAAQLDHRFSRLERTIFQLDR